MSNLLALRRTSGAGACDGDAVQPGQASAALTHSAQNADARTEQATDTLVRAVQDGELAFSLLYERYLDRIYAYIRTRTSSAEDADDLTQQVFLLALRALPRYRAGRVPFAAWLFRIAHNVVIDHHRRSRPSAAWDALPAIMQRPDTCDVEAGALRRERLEQLGTLLGRLDRDKRELLALRFAAGLTIPEIAAVIGKSEAAAKKSLFRVLRDLKEHAHDLAD